MNRDFTEADTSFNKVLQLWESRVKFSSVKDKLCEKSQKFNGSNRIIESEEFQRLVEIAPQLVEFLKENKNLVNIPEIKNMIRLSTSVSQAFDLPKLSYDNIQENGYTIPEDVNHSVYEMICKQELVRKELVESKNKFNLVWLNNPQVSNLASLIYEREDTVIAKALVEAICEVPYLALATKKQITETLTNNLELSESIKVNLKDIKAFSSLLFEYKKPLKKLFVSMLNEKYGISVQNLKDIPTFRSLLNTQVLIFESLAKLSPKGSIVKEILSENSKMLKAKNGVESIDVNRFIELLFEKAEYTDLLGDEPIMENISLKETFSDIESVEELVSVILERVVEAEVPKGASPEPEHLASTRRANRTADEITAKRALEKGKKKKEDTHAASIKSQLAHEKDSMEKLKKARERGEPGAQPYGEQNEEEAPTTAVETPTKEKKALDKDTEETEAKEKEEKTGKATPTSNEIMANFKNFEDILNSINFEDLDTGETEEELDTASEEEAEVDKEEEGEE